MMNLKEAVLVAVDQWPYGRVFTQKTVERMSTTSKEVVNVQVYGE